MKADKPRLAAVGATRGANLGVSWQEEGFATLTAICDLNPQRCEEQVRKVVNGGFSAPQVFGTIDELIKWGQFDAAIIATPDHTHFEVAKRFFDAGFNCYVEKPMTNTVADAAELVRAWKKSGKIGVVGHEFRYTEAVQRAQSHIAAGRIGPPRLVSTFECCGRMGSYWRRKQWRNDTKPTANSLTLQKGIHQLDLQSYLAGARAERVYASGGQDHFGGDKPAGLKCPACGEQETCLYHADKVLVNGRPWPSSTADKLCVYGQDVEMHDNLAATIDYANGVRGSYTECFFTPDYRFEIQIIGDLGRIRLNYYFGNPYLELELSFIGGAARYDRELIAGGGSSHGGGDYLIGQKFCQAVAEQRQIQPDLMDGFDSVALACAIDESAQTKTAQKVAVYPEG